MSKQDRYDQMYINIAHDISDMSHDSEIKVGSIIVKDDNIISMGWNGMPPVLASFIRAFISE